MTAAIAHILRSDRGDWTIKQVSMEHLWGWIANHPNTGETGVTRAVPP